MIVEALDHFVIYSGDSERTIAFYKNVLGLEIKFEDEWRAGKYPIFQIRLSPTQFINVHAAGKELHPRAQTAVPGGADFCFRTPLTPDEVVAHLAMHDVAIVEGPVRRSTADGRPSMSVYFRDGDGNLVELMSPTE